MQDILSIIAAFGVILSGIWAIRLEYRLRSPFLVFWIAQAYFFAIPHFVSVMLGRGGYPEWVLTKASVFALLFNLIYISTRVRLAGRDYSAVRKIRWEIGAEFDSQSKQFLTSLLALWVIGALAHLFVTLRYGAMVVKTCNNI